MFENQSEITWGDRKHVKVHKKKLKKKKKKQVSKLTDDLFSLYSISIIHIS